jgi:hypothetical protein
MLLVIAINELFLGIDTYLAHSISGTIVPREWIPIVFGVTAGVLLGLAGLISLKYRMAANLLATGVFTASIIVGVLGSYFHLYRALQPYAQAGSQVALSFLVWAPPLLGPITFALVGILGMSAAWQEAPFGSGRLVLPGGRMLQMPYSKTRAYFLLAAVAMLATLISSVFDHAHSNFANPWTWIPTVAGVFAMLVMLVLGFIESPSRSDLATYAWTMIGLALVGVLGAVLHIDHNLIRGKEVVLERFIRGAPLLAPLLFANMGLIGLVVLLEEK